MNADTITADLDGRKMQLSLAARRSFGPPTGALFAKPPTPLRAAADQAHGANAGALSPPGGVTIPCHPTVARRSEEQTSELQSLMRISYAVFCLNKKNTLITHTK